MAADVQEMTKEKKHPKEKEMENVKLETGGEAAEAKPVRAEDRVGELEGRLSEMEDRHLRLAAEFDNYRKRTAREYQNVIRTANDRILLELLELYDNFERALAADAGGSDSVKKGVELMAGQLRELLKKEGVAELEVIHKPFDPETSEAIMQMESAEPEGKVIEVLAKGYALNGRVLRPARVVVAKKSKAEESAEESIPE